MRDDWICKKCHTGLKEGTKICPKCGTPYQTFVDQHQTRRERDEVKKQGSRR